MVIPTLGARPELLGVCLRSLAGQRHPPAVVVIVARDPEVIAHPADEPWPFRLILQAAHRLGASAQRNQGVDALLAAGPCEAVLFLDDDVELDERYLEVLVGHLASDPLVGGVAGVTTPSPRPEPAWLRVHQRIFIGRWGGRPRLTAGGVNLPIGPAISEPQRADWLFGCALYRAEAVRAVRWDETMDGYWLLDDVEYSLQVGRRWSLVVDPAARLVHHEGPGGRPDARRLSRQLMVTRHELLRRHRPGPWSLLGFWWMALGEVLLWIGGAATGRPLMRDRLLGGLAGLAAVLRPGRERRS